MAAVLNPIKTFSMRRLYLLSREQGILLKNILSGLDWHLTFKDTQSIIEHQKCINEALFYGKYTPAD